MTNKKRAQYLEAAGKALHGARWQSPMAHSAAREREMTDDIVAALAAAREKESARLVKARAEIDNIRVAPVADLRRSK